MEDNYNVLEILKNNGNTISVKKLTQVIIDRLKSEILKESDILLLNLIFSSQTTQNDLDEFLKIWDIEIVGGHKALMLSYFMKMHPELKFSDYVAPRLKGLIRFYRFQNMKLISHYTKICNELKKNDIEFLIFKGGAIKHLRPEFPRIMGDIDILILEKDYKRAGAIVERMGYDICRDVHSMDIHIKDSEEGIMDIHKFIAMNSDKEKEYIPYLFKRASKQKVFGIDALVPSNEDMVFILLINMVKNLRNKTSNNGIPYNLFDCKFLIDSKPDFDWNIIIDNAQKTNTERQLYFAIQFINSVVPNLLPEKIKYDNFFEKEFKKYCILLIYQRFYLLNMKQKSHSMKIKDMFLNKDNFMEYLRFKPKYFFMKKNFVKKNPFIAEKILKNAGLFV